MYKILEIAEYNLKDFEKYDMYITHSKILNSDLNSITGFLGRKVFIDSNSKTFYDIVLWENNTVAQGAFEKIIQLENSKKTFGFISNVKMHYINILNNTSNDYLNTEVQSCELGITSLIESNNISTIIDYSENVQKKYLNNFDNITGRFIGSNNQNGKYYDILLSKGTLLELKNICNGYFENEVCKKYISQFNEQETELIFLDKIH